MTVYTVAYPMKANAGSSCKSKGITKSKFVLNSAVMVSATEVKFKRWSSLFC